ncbi:uncharacterized protein [Diabrotica undecimpunctata]|uniref:uncharacterized protein n=1 Tax=Diabrotica undecimpunctata TaxID=50387 RepID=UPI003B636432
MATSNNDYKIQIDKLEGPEDWAKWKWHVSMLLRSYALEDIVNGMCKCPEVSEDSTSAEIQKHQQWLKDDAKTASLLAGTLGKTVAELVLTCTHASEILDKLRARFERSSTQRLNMSIEAFFRVQRDEKEDISTHVAKLQKLFVDLNDELQKHDENVLSERMLNGRILSTLGKDFDNFKDLWDTILSKNQTLNLLIEKLCTIELRDQSTVEFFAFVARNSRTEKYNQNQSMKSKKNVHRAKEKFPCHKCKTLGHWAKECRPMAK